MKGDLEGSHPAWGSASVASASPNTSGALRFSQEAAGLLVLPPHLSWNCAYHLSEALPHPLAHFDHIPHGILGCRGNDLPFLEVRGLPKYNNNNDDNNNCY